MLLCESWLRCCFFKPISILNPFGFNEAIVVVAVESAMTFPSKFTTWLAWMLCIFTDVSWYESAGF